MELQWRTSWNYQGLAYNEEGGFGKHYKSLCVVIMVECFQEMKLGLHAIGSNIVSSSVPILGILSFGQRKLSLYSSFHPVAVLGFLSSSPRL